VFWCRHTYQTSESMRTLRHWHRRHLLAEADVVTVAAVTYSETRCNICFADGSTDGLLCERFSCANISAKWLVRSDCCTCLTLLQHVHCSLLFSVHWTGVCKLSWGKLGLGKVGFGRVPKWCHAEGWTRSKHMSLSRPILVSDCVYVTSDVLLSCSAENVTL